MKICSLLASVISFVHPLFQMGSVPLLTSVVGLLKEGTRLLPACLPISLQESSSLTCIYLDTASPEILIKAASYMSGILSKTDRMQGSL